MVNRTIHLGTSWGSSFSATAIHLDGVAYLNRSSALTGVATGKKGLCSFWIKPTANDGGFRRFWYQNVDGNFEIRVGADNMVSFIGRNAATSTILSLATNTAITTASGWKHILASWDLATAFGKIYVNSADDTAASPTLTNDTIDYVDSDTTFGAYINGALPFEGNVSQFYFNMAESLDITNGTNRAKFISGGAPVDLGADGSTPTGTAPIIYFNNPFGTFQDNLGTGGNYTVGASSLTSATAPP